MKDLNPMTDSRLSILDKWELSKESQETANSLAEMNEWPTPYCQALMRQAEFWQWVYFSKIQIETELKEALNAA